MSVDQRLKDALRLIVGDVDVPDSSGERSGSAAEQKRQKQPKPRREPKAGDPAVYPSDWATRDDCHADYLYRRDTILVRTADVERVRSALSRRILPKEAFAVRTFAVIDGVTGLSWRLRRSPEAAKATKSAAAATTDARADDKGSGGKGGEPPGFHNHDEDEPRYSTPWVLARLDEQLGVGVATPDHLLSLCDNGHPCPATEPAMVPSRSAGPVPPVNSGICCGIRGWDGAGVMVGIVDNGLLAQAPLMWPWMAGVDGDKEPVQVGQIAPYACHGTFVAGCVRCTAPKADVYVKRVPYPPDWETAGAVYEDQLIQRMGELLDMGADIIVCEFDGVTRFHLPLLTFEVFHDSRLRHVNVVVVAPAGNDTSRLPTFPAAYSWAIGVGALSADGNRRAGFSNHGGWVDVYAPGEDLVNAFGVGAYTCIEEASPEPKNRQFDGLANWSGTSFSAPLVAGMIAARMSATGENAPRAAEALLRFARSQAIPGVGPVLYPDQVCGTPHERRHAGCDCECGKAVLS